MSQKDRTNIVMSRDSYWSHIFLAALTGLSGNWFLSKKKIVKRAIAIADEAQKQLDEE